MYRCGVGGREGARKKGREGGREEGQEGGREGGMTYFTLEVIL